MNKVLELISQRRIWSSIVGAAGFLLLYFGINVNEPETLIELLTNLGAAIAPLASAGLALWSFLNPKK